MEEDPTNPDRIYGGGNIYTSASGTYQMGVIISTDAGATWSAPILLGALGDYRTGCRGLGLTPSDPQVIYAGGDEDRYVKLWRSGDGGTSWADVTSNLASFHEQYDYISDIWVTPEDANHLLTATTDGVFISSDGGATWSVTSLTQSTVDLEYHPAIDTLYAALQSNGVYRSEDRGATWQAFSTGLEITKTKCIDLDPLKSILYLGTDGGSVWRLALTMPPLAANVHQISAGAGGATHLLLNATPPNGSRNYLILGSISGTSPGTPLPGGLVTLPLNWDIFTSFVIDFVNSPIFSNFMGSLDNDGFNTALFDTIGPMPPSMVGLNLYFAYCLNKPYDYVSNALAIEVIP